MMSDKIYDWWHKTVVYQIYPRSYNDSTGNGIGDLKGIIQKLDYIKDLGVETIWFSPFYPSPTDKPYKEHDCGYDIANYREINPEYGTMADFDELLEGIHSRDMKIVLDMVMNHTSIEHSWFKESRSSRDNPKRDWYVWRDGRKPDGKKPPNNWYGMTGKCWTYDEQTEQYYYHAFLPFQPDLNYRNPEVQEEMLDTVRYWLNKGVDGYRLDIINALFEDAEFRNTPRVFKIISEDLDAIFKSSKMCFNHTDTLEFCKTLRTTIDEFPGKFMVGEVSASMNTLKKYLGEITPDGKTNDGLNLIFLFQAFTTPFKAKAFKKLMQENEKWFPYPYTPTWVFGNHDQFRSISRLGNDFDKARLNATLQLTARGVPFIYYGEEIGMKNMKAKKKNSKDAISHHFNFIPQFVRYFLAKMGLMINRDGCRSPMQWDDTENAGFSPSGIETWLPVDKIHLKRNVKIETANVGSILNCYKRLLKVRRENSALQVGDIEFVDNGKDNKRVLAYKRKFQDDIIYVCLNFTRKIVKVNPIARDIKLLFSTLPNRVAIDLDAFEGKIGVYPLEGIIYK